MDNTKFKSSDNPSITIIPRDYSQIRLQKRSTHLRFMMINAALLLLGGLGAKGWFFFQDWRFQSDGIQTTATIDSWTTQTSYNKGRSLRTHAIDYHFTTDDGKVASGRDWVKSWQHRPKSESGLVPEKNQDLSVEYLKADPKTSRIVIPNRYNGEHRASSYAMILGGVIFLILLINSLPTKRRLQCWGGVLILIGFMFLGLLGQFSILAVSDRKSLLNDGLYLCLAILGIACFVCLTGAAFWYGRLLLQQSRVTFSDPRELFKLDLMPPCGDRITIMPRSFWGSDSALVIDHQHGLIHFVNCHVSSGFLPRVQPIYSCKISRLEFGEKTYASKGQKTTLAIVKTHDGSTNLPLEEPGVAEFLDLLRTEV